jgi:4-diphosphocytidyl-2-C-methyl-D-erythritol kinase
MMLRARAPAKVNLTLHVLGRRADGFHELDSLVAFAGCAADALSLEPGAALSLSSVDGPFAAAAGAGDDNLVLKAARAAAERIEGLRLGAFSLTKRIPVAAGLGGGSADAAAALRLIAEANALAPDDPRLAEAAAATGSDVPACLASRACRMTGRGEEVSPVDLPPLAAVLANPLQAVSTAGIFRALGLSPGAPLSLLAAAGRVAPADRPESGGVLGMELDVEVFAQSGADPTRPGFARPPSPLQGEGFLSPILDAVVSGRNDLEPPASSLLPAIRVGLAALGAAEGCRLARMSGSGATVFGLFDDSGAARRAARSLRRRLPGWWVMPTMLR